MSEKIWDLDSYKENFYKFQEEFNRISQRYAEDQARLEQLRNPNHEKTLGSRMRDKRNQMTKQESTVSFPTNTTQIATRKDRPTGGMSVKNV